MGRPHVKAKATLMRRKPLKETKKATVKPNLRRTPANFHWRILGALSRSLKPYTSVDCGYVLDLFSSLNSDADWDDYMSYADSLSLQSIAGGLAGDSVIDLAALRAVSQLLYKYDDGSSAHADLQRSNAVAKFKASEKRCLEVNRRLRRSALSAFTQKVLCGAAGLLEKWLSFEPDPSEIFYSTGHGKGATADHPYMERDHSFKWTPPYEVSTGSSSTLIEAISLDDRWRRALTEHCETNNLLHCIIDVDTSIVDFVPKDRRSLRTIAKEPSYSMYFQLAYNAILAKKLRKVGVDLSSQVHNQKLAYLGSIGQDYCTIDLSSASDSISSELVYQILPIKWWQALVRCRSRFYNLDGEILPFRKFSSMGNGFTFCLETLIFHSLSYSIWETVGGNAPHCYGDDIIVNRKVADLLIPVLDELGFSTNVDKTFIAGPVRESCGADYFRGLDIRPIYLRSPLTSKPEMYSFLNEMHNWWVRVIGMDNFFETDLYRYVISYHDNNPRLVPLFGPAWMKSTYSFLWDNIPMGWNGKRVRYFKHIPFKLPAPDNWFNVLKARLTRRTQGEFIDRTALPKGGRYVCTTGVLWQMP